MKWIVGSDKDIAVDKSQMLARSEYIRRVTASDVSDWSIIQVNGHKPKEFFYCISNDEVDGTFITAHISDVYQLCSLHEVYGGKLVIANTCILESMADKRLLFSMSRFNQDVELWFAKQELSIDSRRTFRQTTTIINIGQFDFQTSWSERELFKNRKKGLVEAIKKSFIRVSPIILLGN